AAADDERKRFTTMRSKKSAEVTNGNRGHRREAAAEEAFSAASKGCCVEGIGRADERARSGMGKNREKRNGPRRAATAACASGREKWDSGCGASGGSPAREKAKVVCGAAPGPAKGRQINEAGFVKKRPK
ncbi:MAG: hypothetical protein BRD40_01775, partial [Bacteroidetes bacterium QS_1_65_9]